MTGPPLRCMGPVRDRVKDGASVPGSCGELPHRVPVPQGEPLLPLPLPMVLFGEEEHKGLLACSVLVLFFASLVYNFVMRGVAGCHCRVCVCFCVCVCMNDCVCMFCAVTVLPRCSGRCTPTPAFAPCPACVSPRPTPPPSAACSSRGRDGPSAGCGCVCVCCLFHCLYAFPATSPVMCDLCALRNRELPVSVCVCVYVCVSVFYAVCR